MDETRQMLELLNGSFPDIAGMSPLEARTAVDARVRLPDGLDDVVTTSDAIVPTGTHELRVRVYRPRATRHGIPATIYAHGGGFVHGSIASHDGFCRRWTQGTDSVVVSVDYRLAPEHSAPAPVEDVVAAADWAVAAGLADAGLVLAGDSAGGNLAAVASIVLRDRGDSRLRGQVLLYPCLDPSLSSESYRSRGEGCFITSRAMRFYWQTYLGTSALDEVRDWRINPLLASELGGLPPAIVVTAGLDPLCDEGREYARRLAADGTPVVERHYPGQFHGFLTIVGYGPAAAGTALLWSDFHRLSHPEA